MTRTTWIVSLAVAGLLAIVLTACATADPKPDLCEALRPDMPIAYHGKADTPDTINRIRKVNARFAAACN